MTGKQLPDYSVRSLPPEVCLLLLLLSSPRGQQALPPFPLTASVTDCRQVQGARLTFARSAQLSRRLLIARRAASSNELPHEGKAGNQSSIRSAGWPAGSTVKS